MTKQNKLSFKNICQDCEKVTKTGYTTLQGDLVGICLDCENVVVIVTKGVEDEGNLC